MSQNGSSSSRTAMDAWTCTETGMSVDGMHAIDGHHVSRTGDRLIIKRVDGTVVLDEEVPAAVRADPRHWALGRIITLGIELEPGTEFLGTKCLLRDLFDDSALDPSVTEAEHEARREANREFMERELPRARTTVTERDFTISLDEGDPSRYRLAYRGQTLLEEGFPLDQQGGFHWLRATIAHELANSRYDDIHSEPSESMLYAWYTAAEQEASEYIWERAREKEPERPDYPIGQLAAEIRAEPLPEIPWYIKGWLAPGQLLKIAAREKAGKSTFLYFMLGCLERGEAFLGKETQPTTALILTEEPKEMVREKLEIFGISRARIIYTHEWSDAKWSERVRRMAEMAEQLDGGHGLVVIDTIRGAAAIEDENSIEFGTALKLLSEASHATGCAYIVTHHHRKSGGAVWDASSGHTSAGGQTDQNIEMFRVSDDVTDRRRVFHSLGRSILSTWTEGVRWDDDGTTYSTDESAEDDQAKRRENEITADLFTLSQQCGGTATAAEFANAIAGEGADVTNNDRKRAARRLQRLVAKGHATVDTTPGRASVYRVNSQ